MLALLGKKPGDLWWRSMFGSFSFTCWICLWGRKRGAGADALSFVYCQMEHNKTAIACCFPSADKGQGKQRGLPGHPTVGLCSAITHSSDAKQTPRATHHCPSVYYSPSCAHGRLSHGGVVSPRPPVLCFLCRWWCKLLPALLFMGASLASHSSHAAFPANSVSLVKMKYFKHRPRCETW